MSSYDMFLLLHKAIRHWEVSESTVFLYFYTTARALFPSEIDNKKKNIEEARGHLSRINIK